MELNLKQSQKQILSVKMQQSIEILAMNTILLSKYIDELMLSNPVLEKEESLNRDEVYAQTVKKIEWLEENDEQNRSLYRMENEQKDERTDIFYKNDIENLSEYLLFQINILNLEEQKKKILRFLALSVKENGYLEDGALELIVTKFGINKKEAIGYLEILQSFDPIGVAARNLSECLFIQLKRGGGSLLAKKIVKCYLEDLAKNKIAVIAKNLGVSLSEVLEAVNEIKKLEPKPGRGFVDKRGTNYIIPDIIVEKVGDEFLINLNSSSSFKLSINSIYKKILKDDSEKEVMEYCLDKLRQAEWIIRCLSKREETITSVVRVIIERQKSFFTGEDNSLKPLKMNDIAEALNINNSTISRAVKGKYLSFDLGVFPLQYFFSKGLNKKNSHDLVSSDFIKKRMRSLIDKEDKKKPLSDQKITDILKEEGMDISRRGVAKYREEMDIGGMSARRKYSS